MNRSSLLLLIAELPPDASLDPTQVLVVWMFHARKCLLGNLNGARVGPFPVLGMDIRKGKGGPMPWRAGTGSHHRSWL